MLNDSVPKASLWENISQLGSKRDMQTLDVILLITTNGIRQITVQIKN